MLGIDLNQRKRPSECSQEKYRQVWAEVMGSFCLRSMFQEDLFSEGVKHEGSGATDGGSKEEASVW